MDVTSLRYMTSIHSEEPEAQRRLSATESTETTETSATEISNDGSVESSFATALRDEIAQLREGTEDEASDLEASLLSDSTSMLFGTTGTDSLLDTADTLNLGSLSEMMGSTSGRQAIGAMAEASLNSLIFTGSADNDQTTMLEALLQDGQSVQQELADTLEQILSRLEEGHVISE